MKDQFVIACIESAADAAVVLPWVHHFAEHLNHKGVMALHVESDTRKANSEKNDEWLKTLGVPYVSLQGDWRTAIEGLPTAFNGILAVVAVNPQAPRTSLNHPKRLLHEFKNCKTAYLCVNEHSTFNIQHSTLTMTHRREGKELLVWASYLARFLGSKITIAHPDYRDEGLRQRWQNNMRFVDKMFTPLNIEYTSATIDGSTREDLRTLDQVKPDLLIARTTDTRDRDLLDLLQPLPELRLLTHPSHTPLLLLNPRDDLYILCD
ncbi:MAG: hypothetical protein J6V98_03545 [Bacteroidales bacterium]|nr:hypothetical protein [Bacteroidales bacterium]